MFGLEGLLFKIGWQCATTTQVNRGTVTNEGRVIGEQVQDHIFMVSRMRGCQNHKLTEKWTVRPLIMCTHELESTCNTKQFAWGAQKGHSLRDYVIEAVRGSLYYGH